MTKPVKPRLVARHVAVPERSQKKIEENSLIDQLTAKIKLDIIDARLKDGVCPGCGGDLWRTNKETHNVDCVYCGLTVSIIVNSTDFPILLKPDAIKEVPQDDPAIAKMYDTNPEPLPTANLEFTQVPLEAARRSIDPIDLDT